MSEADTCYSTYNAREARNMCSLSFLMFLFGRFVDPRSIETQTNPIDRSIALLLFHQSSDHAAVAVDDASSLKPPAGSKHHQGPAANQNQGLIPDSSVYSPGDGAPKDVQSLDKF